MATLNDEQKLALQKRIKHMSKIMDAAAGDDPVALAETLAEVMDEVAPNAAEVFLIGITFAHAAVATDKQREMSRVLAMLMELSRRMDEIAQERNGETPPEGTLLH